MTNNHLTFEVYGLQKSLLSALRRRWPDACEASLEDAISNLWLELLRHPEPLQSLPPAVRFSWCLQVAHRNMRSEWRIKRRNDELPEESTEELRDEPRIEERFEARRGHQRFLELLPGAAKATCHRHAGVLEVAVREHVEEGISAPDLAEKYDISREYISLVMRQLRGDLRQLSGEEGHPL